MQALLRWAALVACATLPLQMLFVARIAAMAWINPTSTTFQRSEAWAQLADSGRLHWRQQWVPYAQISDHLKRAVIASEDDGFVNHDGVEWNAIEKAWEKNARAEALAAQKEAALPPPPPAKAPPAPPAPLDPPQARARAPPHAQTHCCTAKERTGT